MKSFWISITIFTLMICIILLNSLYISKTTDKLCLMIQTISPPTTEQCNSQIVALEKYWKKHNRIIKLSTPASQINIISNEIIKLKQLALSLEISDFEVTRYQLISTIYNIKTAEMSIENII